METDLIYVLCYHVLLEYIAPTVLRRLPAIGKLVAAISGNLVNLPSFEDE